MLDAVQSALYQRLEAYQLNDNTHEFGFIRHLMKSHGWTQDYSARAITEYKKFAFLAVVADHQVVPSDQVDQVWHAHVLLTQSYWDEFCPKVLGKPLHHHPARGGRPERAEFHDLYTKTIASYRHFFGSPPIKIWSPPDVRFGAELKMQRVNLSDNWIVPKRFPFLLLHFFRKKFCTPLSISAVIACLILIDGAHMAHGFTTDQMKAVVPAHSFLVSYGGPAILGLLARYMILSPSHQPHKPQLDLYETAYLAAGHARAVESSIAKLLHEGYLRLNLRNRTLSIAKILPAGAHEIEHQVMRQVERTPALKELRNINHDETKSLRQSLEHEKLLLSGWAAFIVESFWHLLPLFGILSGLLFPLLVTASSAISDLQAFTVPVRWIGIVTLCCVVAPGLRTRWGRRILDEIRRTHDPFDVMQRFALFGYPKLSGGVLDDLRQAFTAEDQEAAQSSCGCGC
jgi:uncharacterized protein (TIGR04222 family)